MRVDEHGLEQRDDTALRVRVERVAEQLVQLGAVRSQRLRERAVLLVQQRLRGVRDAGDRGLDLLVEPVGHRVEPLLDDVGLDAHVGREHGTRTDPEALTGRVGRVDVHPHGLAHDPQDFGIGFDHFVHHERAAPQLDVFEVLGGCSGSEKRRPSDAPRVSGEVSAPDGSGGVEGAGTSMAERWDNYTDVIRRPRKSGLGRPSAGGGDSRPRRERRSSR